MTGNRVVPVVATPKDWHPSPLTTKGHPITRILNALFGPDRTLTIQLFLHQWGHVLWLIPTLLILGIWAIKFIGREHTFKAYIKAHVQFSTTTTTEEYGNRYVFVVQIPEHGTARLTTKNLSLALTIIDTACVEVRRFKDNGKPRFSLAPIEKCD